MKQQCLLSSWPTALTMTFLPFCDSVHCLFLYLSLFRWVYVWALSWRAWLCLVAVLQRPLCWLSFLVSPPSEGWTSRAWTASSCLELSSQERSTDSRYYILTHVTAG